MIDDLIGQGNEIGMSRSDHDDRDGHDHDAHAGHDHDENDHDEHDGHDHGENYRGTHDDHDGHSEDAHGHDEHDQDEHGHAGHDHAHDLRGASRRSLILALILISIYMVAGVIGGVVSGSLALIADAGHMLTDAAAIGMALFAMWIAERGATIERTYGYYRTEILAAFINALALWLIVGWILWEAFHRFRADEHHVDGWPVLIVGVGGLVVNLIAAWLLHRSSEHSLNVEGAFQHVLADLMGSVGVVISGVLIIWQGWTIVDPILSVVISLLILFSSWNLVMKVFRVLLEGVPEHIDVYKLCSDIEELPGVTVIHDVHVWTITSGNEVLTAHVLLDPEHPGSDQELLQQMQQIVKRRYNIEHVTVQLERSTTMCDEETHHVGHLEHAQRPIGV